MVKGTPPRRNVAIFLDMENLFGGYAGSVAGVQIGKVVSGIEQIVRSSGIGAHTATVRAYANWGRSDMGVYQREMLEYGVEPVQIFSFNKNVKNAADIELCVDVLEVAHDSPWVEVFVIVSGDGGFVPLIRRLHYLNKYAIVVSTNDPKSGDVNQLLKSVADEYHLIDVSGALAAVSTESFSSSTAPETSPVPQSIITNPEVTIEAPTLHEVRTAVIELVNNNVQLLIDGKVNTAALGAKLRNRWPSLDYAAYGSKTLGSFVEKHCELAVHRPVPSKANGTATSHMSQSQARRVLSRQEYLDSVRELFTVGSLGRAVVAHIDQGLDLAQIGSQLKESIQGYSSADTGFPRLYMVLQAALAGTDYYVVRNSDDTMAVVHADYVDFSAALPSITETDLKKPELVRIALGAREPAVIYPEQFILTDVIRVAIEPDCPLGMAEYIDYVAEALPVVPAETIRLTLGLLWHVGVLINDSGTDRIVPSVDAASETKALQLVLDDALRRAAEIGWPVTSDELLDALY